jgi:nucleotide-binding universal stress UspA family protein
VRAVLARDFGPIVGRTLDANVPVIARVTRAGTEGSLLGVSDAMNGPFGEMVRRERREVLAEAQAAAKAEREAWLGELHTQIDESRRWFRTFVVVAAATGALLIVIGLLLWRLLQDNRRLRQAT